MENKIKKLQEMIDKSNRIVFFGGAGVSTESGIPDFRSADGIYHMAYKYPPEKIISHSFFMEHPEEFYKFYKEKMIFLDARPNAAHRKLAEFSEKGKLCAVITQNIDGLHEKAGSKNVYELHGSVHRNYCMKCHRFYGLEEIMQRKGVPYCSCGGMIKPDVVLYEEQLSEEVIEKSIQEISNADLLIIGGTSLSVYPAAGLLQYFRGKNSVLINREQTPYDNTSLLVINENIGETLEKIKV